MRRILSALQDVAPEECARIADDRPAEWNQLFPGSYPDVTSVTDLALTPSERRLHRESEQMFRILDVAARAIVAALTRTGHTLVLRNTGACDIVTLRGVMRAVERGRLSPEPVRIVCEEWSASPSHVAPSYASRRRIHLDKVAARMAVQSAAPSGAPIQLSGTDAESDGDAESRSIRIVLDESASAESRIAAAVLTIRSCFFSTNYELAMIAAERGLALLGERDEAFAGRVLTAFDELDKVGETYSTPAAEIDRDCLLSLEQQRAFYWRSIGVVRSFAGDFDNAVIAFGTAADRPLPAVAAAQIQMYRGLMLAKRMKRPAEARVVLEEAAATIDGATDPTSMLEQGWLRNVLGLTHFAEKRTAPALEQERIAMRCVGRLHDAKATHLKINLISNVSVLYEASRQYPDAIKTWQRFDEISTNWDDSFRKHHAYRSAGLHMKNGDLEAARAGYPVSYACAERLRDPYHMQVIAAGLGQMALVGGDKTEAAQWYQRALDAAHAIGDPMRIGESLAGLVLAGGDGDLATAAAFAEKSTTYVPEVQRFRDAVAQGPEAVLQVLPLPDSKLNRPFDLVNLT